MCKLKKKPILTTWFTYIKEKKNTHILCSKNNLNFKNLDQH